MEHRMTFEFVVGVPDEAGVDAEELREEMREWLADVDDYRASFETELVCEGLKRVLEGVMRRLVHERCGEQYGDEEVETTDKEGNPYRTRRSYLEASKQWKELWAETGWYVAVPEDTDEEVQ